MRRASSIYRSKLERRKYIRSTGLSPLLSILSATIEIQRIFRGYSVRRSLNRPKFKVLRKFPNSSPEIESPKQKFSEKDLVLLQSCFRRKFDTIQLKYLVNYGTFSVYHEACKAIQRRYRQHRKSLVHRIGPNRYLDKRGRVHFFNPQDEAASKIQRIWKSYLDRQVFSFYKNLLKFKEVGNPVEVMKMVNPREAKLLDKASGIHIRFRLGGTTFPPLIFYKIFTHAPLCDVGSYAPRNYTKSGVKDPKFKHNKIKLDVSVKPTTIEWGEKDWYRRVENNNWRPINDDIIDLIDKTEEREIDNITKSSAIKRRIKKMREKKEEAGKRFHFSKLVRKQDLKERRKRRKIRWMRNMYRMAKDGVIDVKNKDVFEKRPVTGIGQEKTDEEVEDLLAWTDNLDFDSYISDWERKGLVVDFKEEHNIRNPESEENFQYQYLGAETKIDYSTTYGYETKESDELENIINELKNEEEEE